MCVIVHQPENAHIDKETARKLWKTNPDGGGFAFIDDNNDLNVTKAMIFKEFWSEFEQARSKHGKRDYLLHMRIATHGKVSLDNVHPFEVDDQTVMAHNGIIHGVTDLLPKDNSISDTKFFVDKLLPQLPWGWQDTPFIVDMVEEWIGWSKLMFLTNDQRMPAQVYRLGKWVEYEGLYMSNDIGLVEKKTTKKAKSGNYYESSEDWNAWYDYRNEDMDGVLFPEWEVDQLMAALKAERNSMYIEHPMVMIDEAELSIECTGCGFEIDIETAECMCWDRVCTECWNYIARCKQKGLCIAAGHVDYDALTESGKEKVYGVDETQGNLTLVKEDDQEATFDLATVARLALE